MEEVSLYESAICRLCAENNTKGELLYTTDGGETDRSSLVNRYLPLKIRDDGKLPRTICPGCNIQLEATVSFFHLLLEGQQKIRELWKLEFEHRRKVDRERLRIERENTEIAIDTPELDDYDDNHQEDPIAQDIIVKILPDGSMYAAEHDMSLQMEGLEKPRRKRGRPPKIHAEESTRGDEEAHDGTSQGEDDKQDEEEEIDGDGRRRRKRKVPKRFSEAVQGKELERIFKEEGVIDDEEDEDVDRDYNDTEERSNLPATEANEEIIGHLETEEGKDLGELVIVNRGRGRGRPKMRRKKTKLTCNLCGRTFLQRSRYIMHKSFHKSIKYECLECNRQFTNVDNFKLHQKTTGHVGERVIEKHNDTKDQDNFSKTETEYNSSEEIRGEEDVVETGVSKLLESDMKIDELPKATVVNKVSARSKDKSAEISSEFFDCDPNIELSSNDISQSEKDGQEAEKPFVCNICDKTFPYHSSLKGHMLTHEVSKTDKGFACDICGKVLNHPSSVVYHREAEHNDGRRFVCNKCGKAFKHKQLLQRHQLVHSEDRPYVCESCNASFKTKANLINHQSTHTGEKKYSCDLCEQQFAHKTSLTLHYRWHSGHKPYKCEVCQKSFSQNGNLQEHMRIHTGEKPYACNHCGRKFTTSSQYKLHVKRHTGERPWKCEFCNKCFLHKDTWKCHVRRHKGEKPFQCAHCNRRFTEQWALKKHLRLHTGEKPYSCNICGKTFADCSNLTKHKKVHRENKMMTINDLSKVSAAGELWQILPADQDGDENSLGAHITQVIAAEGGSEDGAPQIIYVSYQDPDDPNQSRTLHIGMLEDKDATATEQTLSTALNVEENEMIVKHTSHMSQQSSEHMEMDLNEPNIQLQITDEDGNPIPLSIQDARQLLSSGQFNNSDVAEELASQLGVHVHRAININNINNMGGDAAAIIDDTEPQHDGAIVDELTHNIESEDDVAVVSQITSSTAPDLTDGGQTIEITTSDGQKLRLTPYHMDPLQLESEYLTIVQSKQSK